MAPFILGRVAIFWEKIQREMGGRGGFRQKITYRFSSFPRSENNGNVENLFAVWELVRGLGVGKGEFTGILSPYVYPLPLRHPNPVPRHF
jgi:hypothetical protein